MTGEAPGPSGGRPDASAAAPTAPNAPSSAPVQIALLYAAGSGLWILMSDRVVQAWFSDPGAQGLASSVKGALFIAVTTLLLYGVLRRHWQAAPVPVVLQGRRGLLAKALAAVAVAGSLGALAIAYSMDRSQSEQLARLHAVSDLKAEQLGDWLAERARDARMVDAGAESALYLRRMRQGDRSAAAQWQTRLAELRRPTLFDAISVFDDQGQPMWQTDPQRPRPAAAQLESLRALLGQAREGLVGPYRGAEGQLHTDLVLPVRDGAEPGSPILALLVFHMDGANYLPHPLLEWPLPSPTSEVVLVRREGQEVVYLTALRRAPDAALQLRKPLGDKRLLATQLLSSDKPDRQLLDGVDYSGTRAFGIGGRVPGSDWWLLAKTDHAEIIGPAVQQAMWIMLVGGLGLIISASSLYTVRQRQALAASEQAREAQQQRLHVLGLLEGIAESSDDAICAQALDGRYTLFNRAAARYVGQEPGQVLGSPEEALFPAAQAAELRALRQRAVAEGQSVTGELRLDTVQGDKVFLCTFGPLWADGKMNGSFGIWHDVTEARQAEERLARAHRALLTSRACGQALMRAVDEDELLQSVCRIAVETGGYRMAWVGFAELDAARCVRPVAGAGAIDGYLASIAVSWAADDAAGQGPTGTAIREQRTVVAREITTNPAFALWREQAIRRGYAASIALPLRLAPGQCIGSLNLYAVDGRAFGDDETRLVEELADDLAYGIRALRDRQQLVRHARRAEATLALPGMADSMDEAGLVAAVCRQLESLTGSERAWIVFTDGWADSLPAPLASDTPRLELPVMEDGRTAMVVGVEGKGSGYTDADRETLTLIGNIAWRLMQRKRAASALADSERSYRMLTEQVPAIIYRAALDSASTTTYVSPAIASLGYTPGEWMANPDLWVNALHPDDRAQVMDSLASAHRESSGIDLRYRLRTRSGEWRHFEDKAKVVRGEDGRPLHLQGLMIDVTARERAEAELRKLVEAVEQGPNSIVITDLTGAIEYVNEAFVHTTGYPRDEVIGCNPRILQSDEARHDLHLEMWAALASGQPWKGEFYNRRKDGSRLVEFGHVAPVRQPDGRITHYVAVKEDITEKKRIGQELDRYRQHLEELVAERTAQLDEARHRAEAANLAKSVFLANMSHEIRTPMNAIVGLTFLLQQEPVTPRQTQRLAQVNAAAQHLLSVISGILDLSKIEAGKVALEQTDFPLTAVLDHVAGLIDERARAKGLRVIVDRGQVPAWLHGDPTRLRQALLNYADNALKFTEQGEIRLAVTRVSEDAAGLLLRFEVADTGIGIPAESLPRLFRAFEQADASTTRRHGGTGLGLAVASRLATLMGGEAGVESTLGVGSRFWFTARVTRGEAHDGPAPVPGIGSAELSLRQRCAGARLLLAEDDPINREVAIELLHAAGMTVGTAVNGREALERLEAEPFDLVLMDLQMPEMDGFEATHRIRAHPRLSQLPILALTANAFEEDRQACLAAGMNDFVPKPVDPERLYASLLRWLPLQATAPISAPLPAQASAAPAAGGLAGALQAIEGLDVAAGLRALRGDLPALRLMLTRFAASHGDDARQIGAALDAGQVDTAQRLLHTLRGSAGTLGLEHLQASSLALETTLRQADAEPRWPRLVQALQRDIDTVCAGLARLPAPADATHAEAMGLQRALDLLETLEPLVAIDDTTAGELFEPQADALSATFGPAALRLRRELEAFDYPAALLSLRALLAEARQKLAAESCRPADVAPA